MAVPETVARNALIAMINAEFTADDIAAVGDRLDTSLGQDGAKVGVSPLRSGPNTKQRLELLTEIQVQFYNRWDADGDPDRVVDPSVIEGYADRFRRAVDSQQPAGTPDVWWFTVERIDYPHDPTGNKTRFEALITAHGQNPNP